MKKKILALACAMVMTLAMGMTVCAAPSVSAPSVSAPCVSNSAPTVSKVTTPSQSLEYLSVVDMVNNTTVTSDVEATFNAVGMNTVSDAVAYAQKTIGNNVFVATIFDLHVPSGKAATFTVNCPNVYAGQKVLVLHEKSNGEWETITPSNVANGSVTFDANSYSVYAIVVDGTASKTADMSIAVSVMALICLAGAAVCAKKVRFSK